MRVIVTGGSGLVGRRIVPLLSADHDVLNLDLRPPVDGSSSEYLSCDILDAGTVRSAVEGADAIVHAAAIPGPKFGMTDDIYLTNIEGTRRVADAAFAAGIRRFVNISSESVLGFAFGAGRIRPKYFPIDEEHVLAAIDPYGRSKLMAEESLTDKRPPEAVVVSLRPSWVWVEEEYAQCRRLTHDPGQWVGGLWSYIHGDDLAEAVRLALEKELQPGHYPLYITAADNGTIFRTRELAQKHYPQTTFRPGIARYGGLIAGREAMRLLGFSPKLTWRRFLE